MDTWMTDTLLGIGLVLLEATALVAYWVWENFKHWAAATMPAKGAAFRLWLVLSVAPTATAAASFAFFHVGLPVTGALQAAIATPLTGLLLLGLGTELSRWTTRTRGRSRLRNGGAGVKGGPRS
ncbi:hypothetical protein ACWGRF_33125 [Streptomyces zhihengii]